MKQQIINAIDQQYLCAIINSVTRDITLHVHEVFEHLYRTYGNITPQSLQQKEFEVKNMVYNPQDPIDNVFNEIENFTELATHAQVPVSQLQCITIGTIILQKTRIFSVALRAWNAIAVKTWLNFKTHFRDARTELDTLGELEPPTQYSANILQELVDGVTRIINEREEEEKVGDEQLPTEQNMNIMNPPTTTDPYIQSLQFQLQQQQQFMNQVLQQQATNTNNNNNNNNNNRNNNRGRGRGRGRNNYNQRGYRQPRDTSKYCWTHGACGHTGAYCRHPAIGHIPYATFYNKMGGSNQNCNPTNQPTPPQQPYDLPRTNSFHGYQQPQMPQHGTYFQAPPPQYPLPSYQQPYNDNQNQGNHQRHG
jgi:hypothetical protein